MSAEVILDNEYATVWYHPDGQIVHHQYHKFIHGEKFREVLTFGADILEARGATKWLSDDRLNSALPKEDGTWAQTVWMPRIRAIGWKYWAVLYPDKRIGQINLEYIIGLLNKAGVTTQVFDDVDEALNWLRSVD